MFPPFPGFEDFPIHVEVEFDGRTRPVLARIEELPTSPPRAVPVCSFVDAPHQGEWLLGSGARDVYTLGNPDLLLTLRTIPRGSEEGRQSWVELNAWRVQKLQSFVERALVGERNGLQVLRAVELFDLPRPPRLALLSASQGRWCNSWSPTNARTSTDEDITVFDVADFDFFEHGADAKEWLRARWNNPNSSARFAWEWATWADDQRVSYSCGFENAAGEAERVMTWVLTSSSARSQCSWTLNWSENEQKVSWCYYDYDQNTDETSDVLNNWQQWLWARFFTGWRADWLEQHECARKFWQSRALVEVEINELPTMHEQFEARLELRDWLENKATPDEIARLLAL